ncbi:MAG: ABC transporter permease subunit [Pseudomonadota bacterium]
MEKQAPGKKRASWRSPASRGRLYQLLAISLIAAAVWFLAHNTLRNMALRGIQSGFDFLTDPAGFDIGESLFPFDSGQPYWQAFLIGLSNTLRVALLGIVLTTLLGTLLGVGRFSRNALVRGVCYAYVEVFRNIPVLLQLLMWYLLFAQALPAASEAWTLGPLFLSKGGLSFPIPVWSAAGLAFDLPVKGEFAIEHGGALTPEFLAVLLGLTFYTAAFVAEVVRAGIQSVDRGQREAAVALGLNPRQSMRLVLLPQALRVLIPPLTNQFLNLTKNSSLAVAIGYPDVVSIANTALNQTGRAVECIAIVMAVYLCTSLATAGLMHRYNRRAAIKER